MLSALPPEEFARHRRALMNMMGEGSIAVLPAAEQALRNRDSEFRYRQDSDFHYLSGFTEPEAVICLIPGRPQGEFVMFCRPRDKTQEIWNGRRSGPQGVMAEYAVDEAFLIDELDQRLPQLLQGCAKVYCNMGARPGFDRRLLDAVQDLRARARAGVHAPGEFLMLDHLLHDLRLFKSNEELKLMRKAAAISAQAHRRAMRACRPGRFEYELEAEIMHEFLSQGCAAAAYNSIVGGGANACILHYVDNRERLQEGDLVLIDAGAEYDHYAADITRTFPVNGRFSPAQRALYDLVLAAQQAAIAVIRPGAHWNDPHDAAVRCLTTGLRDLGLLQGEVDELIASEAYRPYYMHRTGHWLGMDVHDVGDYKVAEQWRELEPGMVLTVEPGLYIATDATVDARWRGIGIRIEDDVLVTRQGHEVLTAAAPKQAQEIEAWMRGEA